MKGLTAIIAAGGKGTRMGADKNKVFLTLNEKKTILSYTLDVFESNPLVREIIIVSAAVDMEECKSVVEEHGYKKVTAVVEGGKTRQESVCNGLKNVKTELVAIHDAVRAFVTEEIINETAAAALKYGAAAPGVACKDTLKAADKDGFIAATVDRSSTYLIQTPQIFKTELIKKAHKELKTAEATDDCMLMELMGERVKITEGSYENIKLTTPEDMLLGREILKRRGLICG